MNQVVETQEVSERRRHEGEKVMTMRMALIQGIAGLAVLAIVSTPALAQTPQERIDAAMTRSEQAGIPLSLLQSKVAEGQAKGVPMDRIATAVESRLQNLEKARTVMGRAAKDVDAGQLSVGADAIGAGVSDAVLESIAASAGRDRRAVAVAALTQLVLHGIASEAALQKVKDAMAQGPQALANLAAQPGAAGDHTPDVPGSRGSDRNTDAPKRPPSPPPNPRISRPPTIPPGGRRPGP
jgi:microcompartment protein CcmK/EutM